MLQRLKDLDNRPWDIDLDPPQRLVNPERIRRLKQALRNSGMPIPKELG